MVDLEYCCLDEQSCIDLSTVLLFQRAEALTGWKEFTTENGRK